MSSFVGSASSVHSTVADVIASYRRSQYFAAEPTLPSEDPELTEQEDGFAPEQDFEDEALFTSRPRYDGFISQLEWDGFEERSAGSTNNEITETTPLMHKLSFASAPHHHPSINNIDPLPGKPPLRRHSSSSVRQNIATHDFAGKSTFGQTLFNSVAILVGIGILSVSLAFSYAGWFMGTILIIFYGFISCYTAKVLAQIILSDPRLRTYSDIGRKAFGPRSTVLIAVMFCLELFSVSVVLVTLYADSLHSVWDAYSANTYKLWGLIFLVPTVFLPLSVLSYTSILGILSTLLIIAVVLIDGFTKKDSPGSLLSPADTSFNIQSWKGLGVSFGLFMAGFSGHAVIPSLARDMANPSDFGKMIDYAFIVSTAMYAITGIAGYLMFGADVSEEISMDLLRTPSYNPMLNQIALWMLVITPLTKFALTTQPLNTTLEILFGLDNPPTPGTGQTKKLLTLNGLLKVCQRLTITILAVTVSSLVPQFSSMMAFLGSFSAFLICVVGPIAAKITLEGKCSVLDGTIFSIAIVMAIWGTTVAFW